MRGLYHKFLNFVTMITNYKPGVLFIFPSLADFIARTKRLGRKIVLRGISYINMTYYTVRFKRFLISERQAAGISDVLLLWSILSKLSVMKLSSEDDGVRKGERKELRFWKNMVDDVVSGRYCLNINQYLVTIIHAR